MKYKLILAFALIFLAVPLVTAVGQVTNINQNVGLQIAEPVIFPIAYNQTHTFQWHVYNISNEIIMRNDSVSCLFHMYNSSGSQFFDLEKTPFDGQDDFLANVNGGNFSYVGEYSYQIYCNTSVLGGFVKMPFDVTQTGENTSTFDYLPIMIALLTAIGVLLFISVNLSQEYGALSLVLLILPLFLVQGMIQLGNNMLQNVFSDTTFTHNLTAYQIILPILSFIILFVIFTMMIIKSAKQATAVKTGDAE